MPGQLRKPTVHNITPSVSAIAPTDAAVPATAPATASALAPETTAQYLRRKQQHNTGTADNAPVQAQDRDEVRRRFRPNSVTNFRFDDVMDLTTPLKDANVTTLLQHLVARTNRNGQLELYRVLNQTLAASNYECEFPALNNNRNFNRNRRRSADGHRSEIVQS